MAIFIIAAGIAVIGIAVWLLCFGQKTQCRNCGYFISDRAERCPNCGCSVQREDHPPKLKRTHEK